MSEEMKKKEEELIEKGLLVKKYVKKSYWDKPKIVELAKIKKKFPPSMTDKSYFIPTAEENKTIDKSALMSHDPSKYDFPNGEITGSTEKIARARKPGADITEIVEIQKELVENANESIMNDAKQKINADLQSKQAEKEMISSIASAQVSTNASGNN